MTVTISPVISAETSERGPFSVQRLAPERFGGTVDPVMGFDHYRMNGVTFAPHPHAGFSAVSYLFENSAGSLRNRDSLGHDFLVQPGGIVWTQAGSGVVHDELPGEAGRQVHGLQIFVNLSAENKDTEPTVLHLAPAEIPVWTSAAGTRMRIVVGDYEGLRSPLTPTEPFSLFDIRFAADDELILPLAAGENMLIYAVQGSARIEADDASAQLNAGDAVGASATETPCELCLSGDKNAQIIALSGRALSEPVVQYGPFIMNSSAQIDAAIARYQHGRMGILAPLQ